MISKFSSSRNSQVPADGAKVDYLIGLRKGIMAASFFLELFREQEQSDIFQRFCFSFLIQLCQRVIRIESDELVINICDAKYLAARCVAKS